MTNAQITSTDSHPRRRVAVFDSELSYVDTGRGDPIVFLHGNPTSSYLWRNIIPYLSEQGRCLAPDLVGMGQSGKSPTSAYRFVDHARYLDAWFEALNLTSNVTLVIHDWGSALGLHRVARYPEQIKAIAYMEAIAMPMRWEDFGEFDVIFRGLRSGKGEQMILEENFFVETILSRSILRKLSDQEMTAYRAPFLAREARLPTLVWPRQTPSRVSRPMLHRSSSSMGKRCRRVRCPSSSSWANPEPSSGVAYWNPAGPGRTRPKSPSRACISCRKILRMRLVGHCRNL